MNQKVNWDRPLQLFSSSVPPVSSAAGDARGAADGRTPVVLNKFGNGWATVKISTLGANSRDIIYIFDDQGKWIACNYGGSTGCSLYIQNKDLEPATLKLTVEEFTVARVILGNSFGCPAIDSILKKMDDISKIPAELSVNAYNRGLYSTNSKDFERAYNAVIENWKSDV